MAHFFSDIGIVLRKHNVGEKDQVVRVLTQSKGKMVFVAKGVRDPKSKKAGAVDLCMEIGFQARESKRLPYLQQVKVVRSFRDQLVNVGEGFEVLKLVDDLLAEEQVVPGVYELVSATLENIGRNAEVVLLFQVKLLTMLGFLGEHGARSLVHRDPSVAGTATSPLGRGESFYKLLRYWQCSTWEEGLMVEVEEELSGEILVYLNGVVKQVLAA